MKTLQLDQSKALVEDGSNSLSNWKREPPQGPRKCVRIDFNQPLTPNAPNFEPSFPHPPPDPTGSESDFLCPVPFPSLTFPAASPLLHLPALHPSLLLFSSFSPPLSYPRPRPRPSRRLNELFEK